MISPSMLRSKQVGTKKPRPSRRSRKQRRDAKGEAGTAVGAEMGEEEEDKSLLTAGGSDKLGICE